MKQIVIYGAGPYGRIFLAEAERYGAIDVVGFTVDEKYLKEERLAGLPVVPFEQVESIYPPSDYDMIVICGYTRMRNRKEMYEKAKKKGYHLINYISPGAFVESEIEMGDNNAIFSGATVGYGGKMGSGNIIRQNIYLGHEFQMGNHNILSVGCVIGGCCTFKDLTFLGFSVTSGGYRKFGTESLVGMGSVVSKDVPDYATVYGNPAKVASYHEETGVVINEYPKKAIWEAERNG